MQVAEVCEFGGPEVLPLAAAARAHALALAGGLRGKVVLAP
jgi:hypothetical protein